MKKATLIIISFLFIVSCNKPSYNGNIIKDTISHYPIRLDTQHLILPWYSANLGKSYDTVITLLWNFWKMMEQDSNGVKYYMNHQVWHPAHDHRGVGCNQISLTLSSWRLLYQYSGKQEVIDNMTYMADYYLNHSLSDSTDLWPFLPYPFNTSSHSGIYDGDMVMGKDYTQPDKAGDFGLELVCLYKITKNKKYLDAAIKIAQTLALKTQVGDSSHSPLPFIVNTKTGEPGYLNTSAGRKNAEYTTNWAGTLELFETLFKLDVRNSERYQQAFNKILKWMMENPLKNNHWGPFNPDVNENSHINANSFATFIINHQNFFPNWPAEVKSINQWIYHTSRNEDLKKYGVITIHDQNWASSSKTIRQAAFDLKYNEFVKETATRERAIRQLNWATYMVDTDGKNRSLSGDIMLTDGYGDYVQHYINAMGSLPELAPDDKDHLLNSSVVIQKIVYGSRAIYYIAAENKHREVFRLLKKPSKVVVGGIHLNEVDCPCQTGWNWRTLDKGGALTISTDSGNETSIIF